MSWSTGTLPDVALESVKDSAYLAPAPDAARSVAHYNAPTSQNSYVAIEYLRAESLRLSSACKDLGREFEALNDRPFNWGAHAAYQRRLRHFRGLLANHSLALDWTLHPPCGNKGQRVRRFRAIRALPTDFPVIATATDAE